VKREVDLEKKFLEIRDSPEKRAKAFKIIWIVSYAMLMLGSFLIVYFIWLQQYG
jgi:predicted nucleic acid-binding Zn ribbon protein